MPSPWQWCHGVSLCCAAVSGARVQHRLLLGTVTRVPELSHTAPRTHEQFLLSVGLALGLRGQEPLREEQDVDEPPHACRGNNGGTND